MTQKDVVLEVDEACGAGVALRALLGAHAVVDNHETVGDMERK
jgi:hypothetical protein